LETNSNEVTSIIGTGKLKTPLLPTWELKVLVGHMWL